MPINPCGCGGSESEVINVTVNNNGTGTGGGGGGTVVTPPVLVPPPTAPPITPFPPGSGSGYGPGEGDIFVPMECQRVSVCYLSYGSDGTDFAMFDIEHSIIAPDTLGIMDIIGQREDLSLVDILSVRLKYDGLRFNGLQADIVGVPLIQAQRAVKFFDGANGEYPLAFQVEGISVMGGNTGLSATTNRYHGQADLIRTPPTTTPNVPIKLDGAYPSVPGIRFGTADQNSAAWLDVKLCGYVKRAKSLQGLPTCSYIIPFTGLNSAGDCGAFDGGHWDDTLRMYLSNVGADGIETKTGFAFNSLSTFRVSFDYKQVGGGDFMPRLYFAYPGGPWLPAVDFRQPATFGAVQHCQVDIPQARFMGISQLAGSGCGRFRVNCAANFALSNFQILRFQTAPDTVPEDINTNV